MLGRKGEEEAIRFLKKKGFEIIDQNWRFKKYEIDIIAQTNDLLVFVEVKTRSTEKYEQPYEAVTIKKQKHLIEAAEYYLNEKQLDIETRFDVISIIKNGSTQKVKHIPAAFESDILE